MFSGGVKAFEEVAKDECQCEGAIPDQRNISRIYLEMAGKTTPQKKYRITFAEEGAVASQALQPHELAPPSQELLLSSGSPIRDPCTSSLS